MKTIRPISAILLVTVITLTASYAVTKGSKAPEFKLKTIDGKTLSLASLRKGTTKLVVLDFWATNCGPCVAEIPYLQKLHEKYGKKGLALVGIAGYRGDTVRDLKSFAREKKMTYPIPFDSNRSVIRQYGVRGLPTTFLIGKDGTIKGIEIGYTPPQVLESEIKAFLK